MVIKNKCLYLHRKERELKTKYQQRRCIAALKSTNYES
nr:MAG TPA: hypothetical protein [Caudoviricetes sp.]